MTKDSKENPNVINHYRTEIDLRCSKVKLLVSEDVDKMMKGMVELIPFHIGGNVPNEDFIENLDQAKEAGMVFTPDDNAAEDLWNLLVSRGRIEPTDEHKRAHLFHESLKRPELDLSYGPMIGRIMRAYPAAVGSINDLLPLIDEKDLPSDLVRWITPHEYPGVPEDKLPKKELLQKLYGYYYAVVDQLNEALVAIRNGANRAYIQLFHPQQTTIPGLNSNLNIMFGYPHIERREVNLFIKRRKKSGDFSVLDFEINFFSGNYHKDLPFDMLFWTVFCKLFAKYAKVSASSLDMHYDTFDCDLKEKKALEKKDIKISFSDEPKDIYSVRFNHITLEVCHDQSNCSEEAHQSNEAGNPSGEKARSGQGKADEACCEGCGKEARNQDNGIYSDSFRKTEIAPDTPRNKRDWQYQI